MEIIIKLNSDNDNDAILLKSILPMLQKHSANTDTTTVRSDSEQYELCCKLWQMASFKLIDFLLDFEKASPKLDASGKIKIVSFLDLESVGYNLRATSTRVGRISVMSNAINLDKQIWIPPRGRDKVVFVNVTFVDALMDVLKTTKGDQYRAYKRDVACELPL